MKKYLIAAVISVSLMAAPPVMAQQGPIVGFDVLGLSNGNPNFYYQDRMFSNSAFRIGAATNAGGNMVLDLGFRFYFDRYAASPYVQGDIRFGGTMTTYLQAGIDFPAGNLVLDPHVWAGNGNSGVGLNLGFHL